jgi:hypothetical protein
VNQETFYAKSLTTGEIHLFYTDNRRTLIAILAFSMDSLKSGYPNFINDLWICGKITSFVYEQLFNIKRRHVECEVGSPDRPVPDIIIPLSVELLDSFRTALVGLLL